jgi:hypothetical protein
MMISLVAGRREGIVDFGEAKLQVAMIGRSVAAQRVSESSGLRGGRAGWLNGWLGGWTVGEGWRGVIGWCWLTCLPASLRASEALSGMVAARLFPNAFFRDLSGTWRRSYLS